jgi:hypothetical protein
VKPGTKRGPYRTKRSQAELQAAFDKAYGDAPPKIDLRYVDSEWYRDQNHQYDDLKAAMSKPRIVTENTAEREHIDPLDYLQDTIDNPSFPHRDKIIAASTLAPTNTPVAPANSSLNRSCCPSQPALKWRVSRSQ